jgi:uncharacterized membrane-anchored protein YhcB (DUF1043 family)
MEFWLVAVLALVVGLLIGAIAAQVWHEWARLRALDAFAEHLAKEQAELNELRRQRVDAFLKTPLAFKYADRPREDDLRALGLKESDYH